MLRNNPKWDCVTVLQLKYNAPNGILTGQNSLCVQVLRTPIMAALLNGTRTERVSQTLRRGIFNCQGGHPFRHWLVELPSYIDLYTVVHKAVIV